MNKLCNIKSIKWKILRIRKENQMIKSNKLDYNKREKITIRTTQARQLKL